jgi:hypothetical protein
MSVAAPLTHQVFQAGEGSSGVDSFGGLHIGAVRRGGNQQKISDRK